VSLLVVTKNNQVDSQLLLSLSLLFETTHLPTSAYTPPSLSRMRMRMRMRLRCDGEAGSGSEAPNRQRHLRVKVAH